MRVSVRSYERALAIFNTLANAAAERGFKNELTERHSRLRLSLEKVNLDLHITERIEETVVPVLNSRDAKSHVEKKMV